MSAAIEAGHDVVEVNADGILALRHGALLRGTIVFKSQAAWALVRQNLRFRAIVAQQSADAVWIRSSKGIAFVGLGAVLSGRPLVWDVGYEPPSTGLVHLLHHFGLWAASAVVFQYATAPYEIFGEKLARRYRKKFKTIVPGIDLRALDTIAGCRERREKRLDEPFVILQVGTICERKNQLLLIRALSRLGSTVSGRAIVVKLAGGFFEEKYVERVRQEIVAGGLNGVVQLLGWRDDVHDLMTGADLLVLPSYDEGVPNTVQEAMYLGLPVLVSPAGGMPDIVKHGRTGWLELLEQPDAWAKRIQWCIENPEDLKAVGLAASAYAAREFNRDTWGARYAQLIQSLVPPEKMESKR
jgi:glycosyltransferase involved in cell wall biosynthesis